MNRADLTENGTQKRAVELIRVGHVMTLATSGDHKPWSAPVYYIFHKSRFYFFSSPHSRHIKEADLTGAAAASIHESSESWSSIRGIQMEGHIQAAGVGLAPAAAFRAYMNKFSFVHNFSKEGSRIRDIKMLETLFKARWYSFTPERTYYLDNSLGFGYKKSVDLNGF